MPRIEATVTIDRPVEEVWKFITDWSNFPKINPVVLEAKQTSAGPIGTGTTVTTSQEERLGNRATSIRVVEFEPNRKFSLEHTSGPLRGTRTTFATEVIEGKTKLTLASDVNLSGFYKLVWPLASGRARKEVENELGNVKRLVES